MSTASSISVPEMPTELVFPAYGAQVFGPAITETVPYIVANGVGLPRPMGAEVWLSKLLFIF